jgi:hypothetical protein
VRPAPRSTKATLLERLTDEQATGVWPGASLRRRNQRTLGSMDAQWSRTAYVEGRRAGVRRGRMGAGVVHRATPPAYTMI